ncbi:MAG TPA: NfeD family protein [Leucothrix mucor]|uniref:NfeD family protein n=1 Tax=Leucothrix mucor TaxID=45248 RepID=A0A7V2T1E8_LEUMU|nr:NfeD family protein [Leucothrix mucor]
MSELLTQLSDQLNHWHWWSLAVLLIILEIFSPAAFFLWLGIAAAVTGLITLIAPNLHWAIQLVVFSIFSIAAVWLGRSWFQRNPIETDQPFLNQSNEEFVGKIYVVEQAISNGSGRIKVGDSSWKATGEDAAVGDKVRVVSVDATVLMVERVD